MLTIRISYCNQGYIFLLMARKMAIVSLVPGTAAHGARARETPAPAARMRELSPDRPDKTESPYTVDAGHFQLEMGFANYAYDQTGGAIMRAGWERLTPVLNPWSRKMGNLIAAVTLASRARRTASILSPASP